MCRYWFSCVCLVLVLASSVYADEALRELPPAVIDETYAQQISITVSGAAPFTYALGGEEKPAGLSIDPQTGLLHGVPTRAAVGSHRLRVIVTDYAGKQTIEDFLLHVTAPPLAAVAKAVPAAGAVIGSPSIASVRAGLSAVSITSPAFPEGAKSATYVLYRVDAGKPCAADAGKQIATLLGTSVNAKPSEATTLITAQPLQANRILCAVETFEDAADKTVAVSNSNLVTVTTLDANWGRVRAYFVGGVLITNDSSSFSSAHQFYALNLEKTWRLPRCYLRAEVGDGGAPACVDQGAYFTLDLAGGSMNLNHPVQLTGGEGAAGPHFALNNVTVTVTGEETITTAAGSVTLRPRQSFTVTSGTLTGMLTAGPTSGVSLASGTLQIAHGQLAQARIVNPPANWARRLLEIPGVTSYFETRLTSIPVVSNSTNTTCAAGGTTASCAPAAGSNTSSSFLSSPQTANVEVGVYLPFLFTRWDYQNTPNALMIAPIAKVGFNTITGASAQSVVLPSNGGAGTQTFEQIYNFYDYGFRVGHLRLTHSTRIAPELYSYLDFAFGRFSNLESLICHQPFQGGAVIPGSGCVSAFGSQYTLDSRKRLYRLDIEGLLKIPSTPLYVGLNANIGQKQVMAEKLDPNSAAPNDLRFLFATKFDIAALFDRLGVKPQ